jgi:Na+/melibiose symporter-like transporter
MLVLIIPAIFVFFGAFIFIAYPLTEKRLAQYKAEIDGRNK